ncbi:hypothetical protein [uncultured Gimesia sp.]|uniref:hypothetical protein n=1 Tax=uncultured Gimesia sp. TaxID=1678688 RepID=UPI000E81E3AE|nr:hypothetical protein [Planctomycetaceae bacterium]HBL44115.1 hypothetical protein [Planctomycetaceae bacterium]|tara:strand:+ start:821 stop:1324 length:504 start_codon:yes stop_codon:yes gene_type:complete
MKKMKSSILTACIAGNLVYVSLNHVAAQEVTFPDASSRITDPASNLEVSKASASGTIAKPPEATSFARQDTATHLAAGSLSRNSQSDNRNAVLNKNEAIGQLGRTSSSVASSPKSDSLKFSLNTTKAGNQGQISLPASLSARNAPDGTGEENSSINLDVFSQLRLVD